MSTSFKPNSAGIAALLVSGPMQAAMLAAGRVIADVPYAAATEFGHATQAGTPVPGAHTLGLLAAAKSARGRRRT